MDVLIRDLVEEDLPVIFEHQSDPAASRMAAFTPRGREEFNAHWTKILADPAVTKKAILVEGHVVGSVLGFDREGKREVGYWIGRDYWGKGIATVALEQFLDSETGRPLYAVVARENPGSIRVLEKCGFVKVAQRRGSAGGRGPIVDEFVMIRDG